MLEDFDAVYETPVVQFDADELSTGPRVLSLSSEEPQQRIMRVSSLRTASEGELEEVLDLDYVDSPTLMPVQGQRLYRRPDSAEDEGRPGTASNLPTLDSRPGTASPEQRQSAPRAGAALSRQTPPSSLSDTPRDIAWSASPAPTQAPLPKNWLPDMAPRALETQRSGSGDSASASPARLPASDVSRAPPEPHDGSQPSPAVAAVGVAETRGAGGKKDKECAVM